MTPERDQDALKTSALETDGVLVRPIGGQIYLVEEGERAPWDEPDEPDGSPLSGLINRH